MSLSITLTFIGKGRTMAKNNQMTPTQRNYAIARVEDIVKTKEKAVRKGCLLQDARTLTYKELARLIVKGVIKPKKENENDEYTGGYAYLKDVFDIYAATDHFRRNATYDEKACEKQMAAVRERAVAIKDRLMLGDASEVLKMGNDFEAETNGKKSK